MHMCDFNIAIEFIFALSRQEVPGKFERCADMALWQRVTEATLQVWIAVLISFIDSIDQAIRPSSPSRAEAILSIR